MKIKILIIELSEVFSHWLKDPSEINCRISVNNIVQVVRYQSQVQLELQNPSASDQVHLLIQADNIVLGSMTVTLEWMFGAGLHKELDDWINIEVPGESIALITKLQPKEEDPKDLRVRLTGQLTAHRSGHAALDVDSASTSGQALRSPREFQLHVNPPHEEKKEEGKEEEKEKEKEKEEEETKSLIYHAKKPSDTDSLEKEYNFAGKKQQQGKEEDKKKLGAKSPAAKSPVSKSPLSPRSPVQAKSPIPTELKESGVKQTVESNKLSVDPHAPKSGGAKSPQAKSPRDLAPPKSPTAKSPRDPVPPKSPQAKSPRDLQDPVKSPQPKSPRDQAPPKSPQSKIPSVDPTGKPKKIFFPDSDPVESIPPPSPGNTFSPEDLAEIAKHHQSSPNPAEKQPEESKNVDDSLSLGSSALESGDERNLEDFEEAPKKEEPRQRPANLNLTANSVTSPCQYLHCVTRTEWHLQSIMSGLGKLKEELGGSFLKLLEESTRRDSRSPTRSPSRKLTNSGLRTPLVSQRSLNSSMLSCIRVEEENILDIPGNVDVFLDRVSVKNQDILVGCVVGLIAKQSYAQAQCREIDPTKEAIKAQEKARNMIQDSMKATQTEFRQESDNYDVMIKRLRDEIGNISQNLEGTRKKNELLRYEKSSHEKALKALKEEREAISKQYNLSVDVDGIAQLRKANEALEKGRIEIEEKLTQNASQFKTLFEALSAAQSKSIEEKSGFLSEIKSLTSIVDNVDRENHKIKNEIQGMNGFLYVDDELKRMLSGYQQSSRMHSQSLDSIRTQLTYLRSHKEDQGAQAMSLHQKIEAETKKVRSSQASWNKDIEINTETINELNKDFKKLKQEVAYIEEVYSKKNNVDHAFEMVFSKSKHNQETKDQLIGELSYFSDFVFSMSQTFLHQKRIYQRVKSIVDEKEIEVEAMRSAVSEIKSNNPVYFPVPEDNIDQAIADYFNSRDDVLIVPFVRESYGVYLYGSKRVMISNERGKLIVKVGGGFLPIEVFIDNYTDVEFDKYGTKPLEASPKMKKFMAKWVGGLNPRQISPEKLKEGLIKAMEGHKFTSAYGIKDPRMVQKKQQEDFATPPRAETPIIEEDI